MKSISAESLTKSYGKTLAVKDLNFSIDPGETVAFLGPNGAGKSTTIKLLCGILTPTSGQAFLFGMKAGTPAANQKLGLVFGTRSQLYMHMTIEESLNLIAEIYFVTGAQKKMRIGELSELFEIEKHLKSRARTLSLGERMRCELVAALIHRPQILLADEPTLGLDIVAKNQLRALVRQWQSVEKTTLMLTSHDLSDVEALCDRCILIDHGEKQFDGPLDNLKGDLKDVRRISVTVGRRDYPLWSKDGVIGNLQAQGFTHDYEFKTENNPMSEVMSSLSEHYANDLHDLQISEVSLEEVLAKRFHRARSP